MNKQETVALGGGCFWCIEAVFQQLPGVIKVIPGYAAGHTTNPSYTQVCTESTGHAEIVKICFDPKIITLNKIFDVFWQIHDPTSINRQGNDIGSQYRSIILTQTPEQLKIAQESKQKSQAYYTKPIVTEIKPLTKFYQAEDHHHNYYINQKEAPYCQLIIAPKLEKLKNIINK